MNAKTLLRMGESQSLPYSNTFFQLHDIFLNELSTLEARAADTSQVIPSVHSIKSYHTLHKQVCYNHAYRTSPSVLLRADKSGKR